MLISTLAAIADSTDSIQSLAELTVNSWDSGLVLAQNIPQTDIFGDVQRAWNNFVQSGQIWALLMGIAIGWFIRNLTA